MLLTVAAAGIGQDSLDPDAATVIALTRETDAVYAVYNWNKVTRPGEAPSEEWSAEFHSGSLHRVETPRARMVADCKAMTGAYVQMGSREIVRGPQIARAACGVDANTPMLSATVTGRVNGRYGLTVSIEVLDRNGVRTYHIAPNGAIVGASVVDTEGVRWLRARATAMTNSVPEGIFSEESLKVSAVSGKYRAKPDEEVE